METLTKEFLIKKLDSFHRDVKKEFDTIRVEMAAKEDFESLAEITSNAFADVTERFTTLETKISTIDTKVDTLVRFNHQHQIDVLRDDMRIVKTKLGLA